MPDWFRSTEWDDAREAEFFSRLKRARHQKAQYLVIQALTLVSTGRPELAPPALMLIDLFQQEHHESVHASAAFLWKAHALLMLERQEEAFAAFEDSLAARRAMPNVINDAWLDYALAVARRGDRQRYDRVLNVLQEFVSAPAALVLPVAQFQYFAALALICADLGDREGAGRWARNALEAAAKLSPFERHPDVGVVGTTHADLQVELARLAEQV